MTQPDFTHFWHDPVTLTLLGLPGLLSVVLLYSSLWVQTDDCAAATADMESRYAAKLSAADTDPECVQCGTVWTPYWKHDAGGHYLCSACAGFYQHKAHDDFGGRLLQTRSAPVTAGKQLLNLPTVSVVHDICTLTTYVSLTAF